ncbi:MAG: hypothetical protein QCH96_04830 [Candidatus Thermoplasmatota archaeon]|nr:hypothetical protein [Candidatus Thermoplasmatota archaeon]
MEKNSLFKIGAALFTLMLLGSALMMPIPAQTTDNDDIGFIEQGREHPDGPIYLDTVYTPESETTSVSSSTAYHDIGYNSDAGNEIRRAIPIYVSEPVEETTPGRGRTGSLQPTGKDPEDWYRFSVCTGQTISVSIASSQNYACEIWDGAIARGTSHTAEDTDLHYVRVFANPGASDGQYTLSIALSGQNDAGTGTDAGNSITTATPITPGEHHGYLSSTDTEDWYSFQANSGQGIFVTVKPTEKSDYDIHLYDPNGNYVYSGQYYGDTSLEYPADISGTWKIKIDIFPGWDASKWPDNYFLYGSGAYKLELSVGGTATPPPGPIPQKQITPVAKTFIVNYDESSNKDDYGYLAAVPAANYLDDGMRYLSPIIYQGCDYSKLWFSNVDQTTQYLLDDWNTYLERHDVEAIEYIIPSDPIQAAADIATTNWDSSNTVVVAVDGSDFHDELNTIVDKDVSTSLSPSVKRFTADDLKDIGGKYAKAMFVGKQWGAFHVLGLGNDFRGDTGLITNKLDAFGEDWWPNPYDENGPDYDTFIPIAKPGIWFPYVTTTQGLDELQVVQIPGDRYSIPVRSTDCSIEVSISTDSPSTLIVFLIDPKGNIRAPMKPHYNGGEINPIHYWNGGHWQHDTDEFRSWIIEPHTEYTVEMHHPMTGTWTAIVVPYMTKDFQDPGFSGTYHITANLREHNPKRINAALSASNAAVIASMNHAPLLYVTETDVPSATSQAISSLGASNIIFVNLNGVSSASPGATTTYTSMQQVIDAIKADSASENFITITSLATGGGYFAPSAYAAAYHVGPILNIGEIPDIYNTLGIAVVWKQYAGDYYHGCLSVGGLTTLTEPFDLMEAIKAFLNEGIVPSLDLDLLYFGGIHDGIYSWISDYGLDLPGKEAYFFVADRDSDIRDLVCRAMLGNNSYAGHIPVPTAAWASAIIVRDMLYPAIIYANPGRDVTTSQLMNFADGWQWTTIDGTSHTVYSSREQKEILSSHGRFYEGHCLWDNLLERYNTGASVSYYSGHGTGGSGISAMYRVVNEQFPLAQLKYEHLKNHEFPDAWRGYHYDDTQTKTARWGGFTWYNAIEPNLYDLIHFKWVDQLFGNLHSIIDLWMSCTTASHLGAETYLAHGAALYYGNGGTGLCPQADFMDTQWMTDALINGQSIGEALSTYCWLHQRDFTTRDPNVLYHPRALMVTNVQMIFGDPTMIVYSPEWVEPIPISP